MARELPETLLPALEPLRRMIDVLDTAIADYDRRMEEMIQERYPEVRVLTQVPGGRERSPRRGRQRATPGPQDTSRVRSTAPGTSGLSGRQPTRPTTRRSP
jgi:hypothetical protein